MTFDLQALTLKDKIIEAHRALVGNDHSTNGDIGLELEAEGMIHPLSSTFWKSVPDGSLRNNGMEYIFKKPVPIGQVKTALEEFEEYSKQWTFSDTHRTSCHVHVNVQQFTFNEVYAVVGAYWLFEDILVEMCGKHRVGNLFCLRASDSGSTVQSVINSVKSTLTAYNRHFLLDFAPENYKYAALNLAALCRFGSIEFRSMRGIYKKKEIMPWVNLLFTLVQKAKAMGSAVKVYQVFKDATPNGLIEAFFGEYADIIREQPGWKDSVKKSSMFLAQLAFVMTKAERGEFSRPANRPAKAPSLRSAGLNIGTVGSVINSNWDLTVPPPTIHHVPPPPPGNPFSLNSRSLLLIDINQTLELEGEEVFDVPTMPMTWEYAVGDF